MNDIKIDDSLIILESHETEKIPLNPSVTKTIPRKVAFKELYRYASTKDFVMMTIGILFAGVAGGCYPLTT